MDYILIAIGIVLVILMAKLIKKKGVQENIENDESLDTSVTYSPKRVLTESEITFYAKLKLAINDKYYIYPQQAYRTFIKRDTGKDVSYNKKRYAGELSYIADFLIVDKKTNLPIATVEKNDNSHYEKETEARDAKKWKLCKKAGIPYISFWDFALDKKTPYPNKVDYIKDRFQKIGNIDLY